MDAKTLRLLVAGLMLLGGPLAVHSAPIAYDSFSGTAINFDGLTGSPTLGAGEPLSNQYAGLGVTFDVPNFGAFASTSIAAVTTLNSDPNVVFVEQGGGQGGASAVGMNINFATPLSHIGLWMGGSPGSTFTLAIFNGPTLLESLTTGLQSTGILFEGFLALSGSNITRAVVYATNSNGQNFNFAVDDLKFRSVSVPEPGTLALLGLGLVGMGMRRRTKAS